MRPLFIVNARSGANRKLDMVRVIRETCELEHRIFSCGGKEDVDTAIEIATRDGHEVIVAVGGDGTVHEVAKRLIGRDLALAIIPTGSGNGFARHHGVPMNHREAVRVLHRCNRITIDTAEVNEMPFIGVMGVGFAAEVAHHFDKLPRRGVRSYIRASIAAFRRYECSEYELEIDGVRSKHHAFLVEIANTAHWGNGFRIAPQASTRDGLLDIVISEPIRLRDAFAFGSRLRFGTVHKSRRVRMMRAAQVTIRRSCEGAAHLDGEPVILGAELQIRVRPGSLTLLVPEGDRIV